MRTRDAVLGVVLLGAALGLPGCGRPEPPVRLQTEIGRELVYDLVQRDTWPGETETVLEAEARVRLRCVEHTADEGARYEAEVLALRISSPERFGVAVDTRTPEDEPGDRFGTEALVRPLLGITTHVVLSSTGRPQSIRGEPTLVDPIRTWALENPQERGALGGILVKLVDGAIVTATSLDLLAHVLPPNPSAADGSTWTVQTPDGQDGQRPPLGNLDVKLTRPAKDRAVLTADAPIRPTTGAGNGVIGETSAGGIAGGSFHLTGELDTLHGIVRRVELDNEMTLTDPSGSGRTVTTRQSRTFTLVDE